MQPHSNKQININFCLEHWASSQHIRITDYPILLITISDININNQTNLHIFERKSKVTINLFKILHFPQNYFYITKKISNNYKNIIN